jgi:serine/threonine-protein kinase
LLDEVLDAPPEERAARIAKLSGGDADRRRALEQLLAESERDMPLLDAPVSHGFGELMSDSPVARPPELLAGRYRTGRELGRGGMARVYLAHDLKHGRDVAIKIIRPDLSASLGHDRFLREIEIAARLRHPNIVPLYDSGDAGDSLYFVMPYEDGQSLRERLKRDGSLPIPDALNVLRDVARALAHAHDHGVVHRDVKPDNVMLSGGAAVVTDFGIAKAVSVALTDAPDATTLTVAGTVIGTPAYMAPEQATGDTAIDHRADIYSFGCLGYELFAGTPPFQDSSPHRVIAAHISAVPRPIAELRADVPAVVADVLTRCLAKDAADRPQTAREVLAILDGATSNPAPVALPKRRVKRASTWIAVASLAGVVALGAYFATRNTGAPAPMTVTVLPFNNIAGDTALDFIADGIGDEIAAAIGRIPGIQIKSQIGARAYRGVLAPDVVEVGAKLRTDHVMTGVVRQERGQWIVSANFERTADATSFWGNDFRFGPNQQASAAGAIATSLAAELRRRFPRVIGVPTVPAIATREPDGEAFRIRMLGSHQLRLRKQSVNEGADLFRQAIQIDSLYAGAYSGLSMALALFPYFESTPTAKIFDEATRAAHRAIALDTNLSEPRIALGLLHQLSYDWARAETEFEQAVRKERDPNVEARVQYARHLLFRGFHAEALTQLRAARAVDATSALVLSWMSYAYFLNGQRDSALVESRRALSNDTANYTSLTLGALIRIGTRDSAEARALIRRAPPQSPVNGYILARVGDTATALARLRELDAQPGPVWMRESAHAFTYLGMDDTTKALAALERATANKEIWPSLYGATDPIYAGVRRSARFRELLRRVGLTPQLLSPAAR